MVVSFLRGGGVERDQRRLKPTTAAMSKAVRALRIVSVEAEAPLGDDGIDDWPPVRDGRVFGNVPGAVEGPVAPVAREAGIVVEVNPRPLGPILILSPFTTIVVGVAEGPMLYVVPDTITSEEPIPIVTPLTVVVENPESRKGVEAISTPLGPILMAWPFTTIVVGVAEGPILYVVPDMTAWVEPIPTVTAPTAVVEKSERRKVVEAIPTPPEPMLMVWPFTTMVVGVAVGPVSYVVPDTTT